MLKKLAKIFPIAFFVTSLFILGKSINIQFPLAQAQDANWCNPDPAGTDYGSPCEPNGATDCGGDGKETVCQNNTWHATGNCCSPPDGDDGGSGCLYDITGYVRATGSLHSGYAQCNNSGHWCIKLDGLPAEYNNSGCYVAELYTDPVQSCDNQQTHLRSRVDAKNGTEICFDSSGWGDDCRAQLDIRRNVSGAPAGNIKTYLIDCNKTPKSTPTPAPNPPSANFSAICYPADQEYNDLSYRFSLNNISGSGKFQQATLFLSFNNNNQSTEQENAIKGFLGEPTWPSGSWYGYWLDRQFSMNNQSLNFRTWDEQLIIGGDKGNKKTIDDLVDQTQTWIQQGIFPKNYTYLVEASVTFDYNGTINKTDSVGSKRVSLLPDACAEPPPAPQCTNIQMFPSTYPPSSTPITDFSTLKIGQQVSFLCEATPADPNQIFKYRVIRVDDNDPSKGRIVENFHDGYGIGHSGSFKIPDSGKYFAQCVTCEQISDFEFNCAEWEPIPNITVQDMHGGPAPIDEGLHCRTNASEQNCYNDIQCIECYGSGAVCNDNGRCEIPTGGMPID